jgi:hypothetical protein
MPKFGEYDVSVEQNGDQWEVVVKSPEGEMLRSSESARCLALYNAERELDRKTNRLTDALNWIYEARATEYNAVVEEFERERCRPATASVAR